MAIGKSVVVTTRDITPLNIIYSSHELYIYANAFDM